MSKESTSSSANVILIRTIFKINLWKSSLFLFYNRFPAVSLTRYNEISRRKLIFICQLALQIIQKIIWAILRKLWLLFLLLWPFLLYFINEREVLLLALIKFIIALFIAFTWVTQTIIHLCHQWHVSLILSRGPLLVFVLLFIVHNLKSIATVLNKHWKGITSLLIVLPYVRRVNLIILITFIWTFINLILLLALKLIVVECLSSLWNYLCGTCNLSLPL